MYLRYTVCPQTKSLLYDFGKTYNITFFLYIIITLTLSNNFGDESNGGRYTGNL